MARYDAGGLRSFAAAALKKVGLPSEPAEAVAGGLLLADLYGHDTHGLALLSDYVAEIEAGDMEKDGAPAVLTDFAAVATWDARRLPGVWVTGLAVAEATRRAETHGLGAIAIRRSHHIACLAAFLEEPARRGYLILVLSSDPSAAHVAPFGGREAVMTPNPLAAGIPGDPDPIMLDVSMSITTAAMASRLRTEKRRFPGRWLLDRDGNPTDDPSDFGKAGGTILPMGGVDHGHKGYALAILVEALTQGLSGFGRADGPTGWGASVLVLALSPKAFGPEEDFRRQVNWLADACRRNPPVPGGRAVRLPGEAALARKAEAERQGVPLRDALVTDLTALADRLKVRLPPAR